MDASTKGAAFSAFLTTLAVGMFAFATSFPPQGGSGGGASSLASVLAEGNTTGGTNIVMSSGGDMLDSSASTLLLGSSGTARWGISTAGHLLSQSDGTYDIGAQGANRPGSGYFSEALNIGTPTETSTATGDIVAGTGTSDLTYDASARSITFGTEALTSTIKGRAATTINTDGANIQIEGGAGSATNADGGDVLLDAGAGIGSGGDGVVRAASARGRFVVGDWTGSSSRGSGTGNWFAPAGGQTVVTEAATSTTVSTARYILGQYDAGGGATAAGFGVTDIVGLDISGGYQNATAIEHYWNTTGTGPNRSGGISFHVWTDSTGSESSNPALVIEGDGSGNPNQIVTAKEGFRVGSVTTDPAIGDVIAGTSGGNTMHYDTSADKLEFAGGSTSIETTSGDLTLTAQSGYVVLSSSKGTTGDPTGAEGMIYINTVDNVVKIYADGAWRTIASGW